MIDEKSSMLKSLARNLLRTNGPVHAYWNQLVIKYDRENNTAKSYKPKYVGPSSCMLLMHPLIHTYTTLKVAFDKDKKDNEAFNLSNPNDVDDLFSGCSYITVKQEIAEDDLHDFLTSIKECGNYPEQKDLGEIGNFSYYWFGQYIEVADWADQDNRWNAFKFEKALTAHMQDFIKYYCFKQVNKMQPTVHSLDLRMAESIVLTINDNFAIEIPFLEPRGEESGEDEENIQGLSDDILVSTIVSRVFFQLPQLLKEYIDVDVKMLVDSFIYGPSSSNKRDNDLIDIACNSSLDLVSYLEQCAAYIDAHPDCYREDSLEYAAYLKHASQNPTAIEYSLTC